MKIKKTSGFSLIEMLVVVAIIGILAGISFGTYGHFIDTANKKNDADLCSYVKVAWTRYHQENEMWPSEINSGKVYQMDKDFCKILGKENLLDVLYEGRNEGGINVSSGNSREPELVVGLLSSIGLDIFKRKRGNVSKTEMKDFLIQFCVDYDENGIIDSRDGLPGAFNNRTIRGDVAVWCWPKDGENSEGEIWVKSW